MYDEFERSLSDRRRSRFSMGTWILFGLTGFVFMGIAASVVGFFAVRHEVTRVVERIEDRPDLRAIASLEALESVVAGEPRMAEALTAARMFGNLESGLDFGDQAEGTRLRIRANGRELLLGSGDHAVPPPSWLPAVGERPENARQVFSARSEAGALGAVAWKVDGSPESVVDAFRQALESEGFELRAEGTHAEGEGDRRESGATVWGETADGDRHVFVVAGREAGGQTSVLLGYADRRR